MKQKHEHITLSFPKDLNALLHDRIQSRGISKFVADAVRKALEEEQHKELQKLEAAYKESNKDRNRLKTIEDWKAIDEEDNIEGWEWK